eukprot:m.62351 g.62351  ORF g.62351 m.62351 type:complete len:61 (+) comp49546_c0_seq1:985-1167(+)
MRRIVAIWTLFSTFSSTASLALLPATSRTACANCLIAVCTLVFPLDNVFGLASLFPWSMR